MRLATILGIFAVMLTLVPGLVFAENVIDDSKNPGYLFVISGTSGSLKGDTLTLNGVPDVIYFSDRPARIAGHISLEKFVEMWDKSADSFKADPPRKNATLSVLKKDGAKNVVVGVSCVEQKSGSVVFKAAALEGYLPESFKISPQLIDGTRKPALADIVAQAHPPSFISRPIDISDPADTVPIDVEAENTAPLPSPPLEGNDDGEEEVSE